MSEFQIHPQLMEDCHILGRFIHCHVLLNRNALLPWFILVPEVDQDDFLDLPSPQREQVLGECVIVSEFIKQELGFDKVNFAGLGNVVPQLHLHVIARKKGDSCWPKPVWGHLGESKEYQPEQLQQLVEGLNLSMN